MAKLSDTIEEFILSMLNACDDTVDLRRNELAEYFGCVPSQINYVISTRFTMDKGFSVESKKGGGGYVRIIRHKAHGDDFLIYLLTERIGNEISFKECENIVSRLVNEEYISQREGHIILAVLKDLQIPVKLGMKDVLRANILKNIIVAILKDKEEN